jgi:hypothetical protein
MVLHVAQVLVMPFPKGLTSHNNQQTFVFKNIIVLTSRYPSNTMGKKREKKYYILKTLLEQAF